MHEIFGLLSVAIGFLGFVIYVRGILKKTIIPHAFTWGVWSLIAIIASVAQVSDGAGAGAWATITAAVQTLIIALLALRAGQNDITRGDCVSFILALLAIPLWLTTHNPLWAVMMVSCADSFGFYPSFRKGYFKPWEDSVSTFLTAIIKFSLSLIALENITLVTALYPANVVIMNVIFVLMLIVRRRVIPKA